MFGNKFDDSRDAGSLRIQDRACPERQWEIHAIPQAIGKKQLGGGEGDILRPQPENVLRIVPRCSQHVSMPVNGGLRLASTPRSVEHEGRIAGESLCRLASVGSLRYPISPSSARDSVSLRWTLTHHDNRHLRPFARGRQERFEHFRMNDGRLWLAVFDVMNVVRGT